MVFFRLNILLAGVVIGAALLAAPLALASEITGTLSTQPGGAATDYRPAGNLQFSVIDASQSASSDWDLPMAVKVVLIGGVIAEIMVLVSLNFFKKEKNRVY